jgi:hypothetical protein
MNQNALLIMVAVVTAIAQKQMIVHVVMKRVMKKTIVTVTVFNAVT